LQGELQQTGFVLGFTQRNTWTGSPSWTFGITERLFWQSSYQFVDAQYQDGIRFGLVDYQVHGGTTGMTYNLGQLDQVKLTGEYTLVRTPFIRQDSTYYGAQGGWTHDFGHEMTGSLSGGVRFVSSTQDIPGGALTDHETVWVYRGTLRKKFERTTIQMDVSRDINPSGFGRLLRTDRVGGSLSHNLTETLTASLNGGLYFVGGIVTNASSSSVPQSRYASISPSMSWKFSQWWTVDVAYTYAERAVDSRNQWSFANSTFVMLTYGGPKWSMSR
jgi:long-subunit fatty acid transport protein